MRLHPPAAVAACLLACLLGGAGCGDGTRARSELSFAEIASLVGESTAADVARLLGEPDTRQPVFLHDERWIWWNYTFLAGRDFPPEAQGQVVHLAITFRNPARFEGESAPYSEWRLAGSFAVTYLTAGTAESAAPRPRFTASR